MQRRHRSSSLSSGFDNPNMVSTGGLVPVLALAEQAGLRRLTDEYLTVPTDKGAHAGSKVAALVAGMVAGADSIEDMNLLRDGGMPGLFAGTYAPSTRTADVVARIHCRWVAGTNYGAICPTNRVISKSPLASWLAWKPRKRSNASVTHAAGIPGPMTQISDA